MTVETPVIKQMFHSEYGYAHLPNGLRLQVLPDLAALPMCQKNQSVAFVASRGQLIIWDDDPSLILARVAKLEEDLLSIIWKGKTLTHDTVFEVEKKSAEVDVSVAELHSDGGDTDSEAARGSPSTQRRKLYFAYPVISCLAVALAIGSLGSSYGNIAKEVRLDGNYIRCALALMFPFVIWASLVGLCLPHLLDPADKVKVLLASRYYQHIPNCWTNPSSPRKHSFLLWSSPTPS